MVEKVIIVGAAGRDFHNFNVYFRNNKRYNVVAFTATQIPGIDKRLYPPKLAGKLYPKGIPVFSEDKLVDLINHYKADLVAFSYSDVLHTDVMHTASTVVAEGADFIMIGATYTMLRSKKPIISICAVRTGCGKSQTTRKVCDIISSLEKRVVVIRHPMPYGDLESQIVQRYATYDDFERHKCTIEEMEEYEPLINKGIVVYAGIDYEKILKKAEKEADVIIWDGGNNDTPFYKPDLHIVVFDSLRAGHELLYYPGEINMKMADVAIINKVNTAKQRDVEKVRKNIEKYAPDADIILAESEVTIDDPESVKGKRVLVIEDGPTLTHGGMAYGAGIVAARRYDAAGIVDPRLSAVDSISRVYKKYKHLDLVLPAMGYDEDQIKDLESTINNAECDLVLSATPIDLTRIISVNKPVLRVKYEYKDNGRPIIGEVLLDRLKNI